MRWQDTYEIDRRIRIERVGNRFHLYVDDVLQLKGVSGDPRAFKDERNARLEGRKAVRQKMRQES